MKTARLIHAVAANITSLVLSCAQPTASLAEEASPAVRFTQTVVPLGGTNLVPNGSFETGAAGWSSQGQGAGYKNSWAPLIADWGNFDALHGEIVTADAAHGRSFLRIRLGGEHTPTFNFDYFEPVHRRELRPLAANRGWIEVTPGQPYTLSLEMRASRNGVPGVLGVHNEDAGKGWEDAREQLLQNVTLSRQWKRYSHTFTPKFPFLFVLAGPNLAREEEVAVDVDAIQLEKGSQATAFRPRSDLEIGVMPAEPGGVFTSGQPATLKIAACNHAGTPARTQLHFTVTDFADQPVALPDVVLEVPATAAVEEFVVLPADWMGFYRVAAAWKCGETEESRLVRVSIVPPRTTPETVLGINHAYPTKSLITLAKKAGVSWYRDWSLKWQHIEPARGQFRWEVSDPQIHRIAGQDGLNLMAMIPFPSADWNSSAPDLQTIRDASSRYRIGGKGDSNELLMRARWAWAPKEVSELAGFAKTVVGRYRSQVQVWALLNEPLFTPYSLPDSRFFQRKAKVKGHTVDDYITLLREVAPAIRAANPGARIMGGPQTPPASMYVEPMLKAGVLKYVDILDLHDYPKDTTPETRIASYSKLLADMKAYGGPKPIWITEFSYYGSDDLPRKPFEPVPGLFSERRLLSSEKQAADYIVRHCTILLGRGVERIFLHSGCTGSVNKPGTESCMFADDGGVRKVFPAMAVFTESMGPSPKLVADKTDGGAYIFAFETGTQAVLVLWDPEEESTVAIPFGVICHDIMGSRLVGPILKLTGSPVYFIGSPNTAKDMFTACNGTPPDCEDTGL